MADIPEGFVRTSTAKNWQGKIRCAHCSSSGWPGGGAKWWGHKHGANCKKRDDYAVVRSAWSGSSDFLADEEVRNALAEEFTQDALDDKVFYTRLALAFRAGWEYHAAQEDGLLYD